MKRSFTEQNGIPVRGLSGYTPDSVCRPDLTTKPVDVDHDRIVINGNRIAPDMLIDHILGENLLDAS